MKKVYGINIFLIKKVIIFIYLDKSEDVQSSAPNKRKKEIETGKKEFKKYDSVSKSVFRINTFMK